MGEYLEPKAQFGQDLPVNGALAAWAEMCQQASVPAQVTVYPLDGQFVGRPAGIVMGTSALGITEFFVRTALKLFIAGQAKSFFHSIGIIKRIYPYIP
ncbi:hypothetical protein, partial [Yeosuana aromativorans]|uniref:hypothetical protein n=1 Tax=Yeosuana aromativorans TaxID=288019 RepID=UPI0016692C14